LKKIIIIPARLHSERLPLKPLKLIGEKPMIQWTYDAAILSNADEVKIATDSIEIQSIFDDGIALMTSSMHKSGTERVYEVAKKISKSKDDVIINLQGDEPFINKLDLNNLFSALVEVENEMATLYREINSKDELTDENIVKVKLNNGYAEEFSRNFKQSDDCYVHLGVYAFSGNSLENYNNLEPTDSEKIQKLEQLRAIENNIPIKGIKSLAKIHIGVDTEEDLIKANEVIKKSN
tara:strand:+ start:2847 stop:3554 length:708 start_codon:yes stop_codon:yes gene_type:complete